MSRDLEAVRRRVLFVSAAFGGGGQLALMIANVWLFMALASGSEKEKEE